MKKLNKKLYFFIICGMGAFFYGFYRFYAYKELIFMAVFSLFFTMLFLLVKKSIRLKSLEYRLLSIEKMISQTSSVIEEFKKGRIDKRFNKDHEMSDDLSELKNLLNELFEALVNEMNDKSQKEKLLIHQSKFATMGEMLSNIAHQWRQPLSEINAILMKMQVKNEHDDLNKDELDRYICECDTVLSHMSDTINDFQNFFKPSKRKNIFSLKQTCQEASHIIAQSLVNNNIKFIIDIQNDAKVLGYPREFAQVILNLLSNSKDMLVQRNISNPYIKLIIKTGKRYALVSVQDNAKGIDKEHVDKIFEPYFTTKHAKAGTGIGLYMSRIIIEDNMNGVLKFYNTSDGVIFQIKLSLSNKP